MIPDKRNVTEIYTDAKFSAFYYFRAETFPAENATLKRIPEVYIPSLRFCCAIGDKFYLSISDRPRNIYPIAYLHEYQCFTTRPKWPDISVESKLEPIKISPDIVQIILKIKELCNRLHKDGSAAIRAQYQESVAQLQFRIQKEILWRLPIKLPKEYEVKLERKYQMLPFNMLQESTLEMQSIWYARFRSPAGVKLYHASTVEARENYDKARGEIQLTPENDRLFQVSFHNLFVESTQDAQTRYLSADAAVKANPLDENLKREKHEAYNVLYNNSTRDSQDDIDYSFWNNFQTIEVNLRKRILQAMMKLYNDAPQEAQKEFEMAFND